MDYLQQNKTESKLQPSQNSSYNQTAAVSYNKRLSYSNTEWKKIQSTLNDTIHSDLVTDGIPGKLTADAVYTFQSIKGLGSKDGKYGPKTKEALNVYTPNVTPWYEKKTDTQTPTSEKVTIPSGSTIMSKSYTPDLDLLNRHAAQEGFNVKDIGESAKYVAKYCTGSNSQHQCTRGTSLFLQLASYARGEANKKYTSSCAAHLFGSTNPMTNYNISSSVAGEYTKSSAENKTGKSNMNLQISDKLKKDGDFVTFQYANSQHIVFYSGGSYYSDFKQGTAAGCGSSNTRYSNIHYFNR